MIEANPRQTARNDISNSRFSNNASPELHFLLTLNPGSAEFAELFPAFLLLGDECANIRALPEEDAKLFIEIIDRALRAARLEPELRRRAFSVLRRLCGRVGHLPESHLLPKELGLSGSLRTSGSFAEVRVGVAKGKDVAVKTLRVSEGDDKARIRKRFCKEAVLWKRLSHPNVLGLIGVPDTLKDGRFSTVSGWMTNGNIMEYVHNNAGNHLELLSDATKGLKYLHKANIAHGNLKGANILITNTVPVRACLADSGFMTVVRDPSLGMESSQSTLCEETIPFMAPEFLAPPGPGLGGSTPSKEADIYALAMVIYQVLTGTRPFHQLPLCEVVIQVLTGGKPSKPTNALDIGLSDGVWKLLEDCWKTEHTLRPPVKDVLGRVRAASLVCGILPSVGGIPRRDEDFEPDPVTFDRPLSQSYWNPDRAPWGKDRALSGPPEAGRDGLRSPLKFSPPRALPPVPANRLSRQEIGFGTPRPMMRVPQEIVDAVIDCFGAPLDEPQNHDPIFYRWDLDKSVLNSWALVSRACNHRVRYYLFSHCKIVASPPFLRTFTQCPDVLLTYTRFLYICRPRSLEEIRSIIPRFVSSPLVQVKFVSAPILAGFPSVFGSFLPDVRSVRFERCLFDPIALVKFRGHRDLRKVAVENCYANGILESIEDIRAGIPRRLPDESGETGEVVGHVLRPLRALRLDSAEGQSENELLEACAKSLQFIEVKTKNHWLSPSTCLNFGTCSKLRTITLEGGSNETLTISNLVVLLSTLRNPKRLSRIRVFARNFSFLRYDKRSPLEPGVWQRLDGLLCGLHPKMQKGGGEGLTFQIASRKATVPVVPSGYLLGLLPDFGRIGTCEEVMC